MYRVHNQMNTNLFWGCLLCNHSIQEVIHVLYRYQKQIHQTNLKAHSMISPKQLALKQIGYCPQRQQRFILCKILLPRMLLLIILHEAASRLFTALQLLNVWIESWENWKPGQNLGASHFIGSLFLSGVYRSVVESSQEPKQTPTTTITGGLLREKN